MEKSTKENRVDAFVENVGFAMEAAREAVNNTADGVNDFINEVKTSETYANIKEDATDLVEKTATVGKAAFNLAKAFIKSKRNK